MIPNNPIEQRNGSSGGMESKYLASSFFVAWRRASKKEPSFSRLVSSISVAPTSIRKQIANRDGMIRLFCCVRVGFRQNTSRVSGQVRRPIQIRVIHCKDGEDRLQTLPTILNRLSPQ